MPPVCSSPTPRRGSLLALVAAMLVTLGPASLAAIQPAAGPTVPAPARTAAGGGLAPAVTAAAAERLRNQELMARAAVDAGLDTQPQVLRRLELARQSALAGAWQQQIVQSFEPPEAALRAEYEQQKQMLGADEVRVSLVLLRDEPTARQVLEKLQAGASFEQLVAEFSIDSETRASQGLTPWVPTGRLVPAVAAALTGLAAGALVPAPLHTPGGWNVLRLQQRRPFVAPAMDQVLPQLRQALANRILQAELVTLRRKAGLD